MRVARLNVPGVAYHLRWRFVDRNWFFTSEDERATYLRFLGRALHGTDWRCIAYAVMSNHIHLACIAGRDPLQSWAKRAHSPFARWMNKRHGRLGPLMADRPASDAVRREREAELIAYIHRNPVRAGVVARAVDSSWTSHRSFAGLTIPPRWLDVDTALARTGIAASSFDTWVNATPGCAEDLELREIRKAARKRGAVEVATPNDSGVVPLVRRPFGAIRPDPTRLVQIAADATGVSLDVLRSKQRGRAAVAARYAVIHCAHRLGVTGADTAAVLGLSQARVSVVLREKPDPLASAALTLTWSRLEIDLPTFLVGDDGPPRR